MKRYRRGGPMYWYWGLLMFRHPGVVLVLLLMMFIPWAMRERAGRHYARRILVSAKSSPLDSSAAPFTRAHE